MYVFGRKLKYVKKAHACTQRMCQQSRDSINPGPFHREADEQTTGGHRALITIIVPGPFAIRY